MQDIDTAKISIYFIVEFNWPNDITPDMMEASAKLHSTVETQDWIEEIVAGYGGIGEGKACIWIFTVKDYSLVNKILNPMFNEDNPVTKAYSEFFGEMKDVSVRVKHQVYFG